MYFYAPLVRKGELVTTAWLREEHRSFCVNIFVVLVATRSVVSVVGILNGTRSGTPCMPAALVTTNNPYTTKNVNIQPELSVSVLDVQVSRPWPRASHIILSKRMDDVCKLVELYTATDMCN